MTSYKVTINFADGTTYTATVDSVPDHITAYKRARMRARSELFDVGRVIDIEVRECLKSK